MFRSLPALHQANKKGLGSIRTVIGRLAILAVGPAGVAVAQDLPPPDTRRTLPLPEVRHVAVDGSAVGSSLGDRSVDLNVTFAPLGDINASGLRVRLSESASWYRFVTNPTPLTLGSGQTFESGVLAGYQFSMERVSFLGLVGIAGAVSHDNGVSSTHFGVKTVGSFYARPTDLTMAYGSVSYSTIANFLQVQSKVGVKLFGNVYVGPEANFSWRNVLPSTSNVGLMRLGAHVSAMALGPGFVGVSGGWAQEQQLGRGYYGGVNYFGTF
jgi:hypothetical protein